ncbi:DUF3108 domain-containing protein [Lysobacter sp. GX 14042]|uniref:DUF3108 domain-containing protein n=1 Tax=Lysobacter sp. GX 14042 TaxID=2907155 RepID=UPI001F2C605B|nr:DUF3108 domain-containing protein [Lysobacter sp. GX 14042]MCE7031852.1 DUF3108 domain-containing protein [Lysobacter sp. GX 14042]
MPSHTTAPRARLPVLAAGAALALATAPALALEAFNADYQASYMGMKATGTMTLAPEGAGRWRYSLDISNALASLSQSTVFEAQGDQWRPLTSRDRSKVLVKSSDKTARYDWGKGVAQWSGDVKSDRAGPIKLQAGDMDALLINLALVRDWQAGKPLKYRMVDDGRVKQLNYREAGTEQISIGGQSREATRLVHDEGDKQTLVWVVEGMPVPARIQQRKDGEDAINLTVVSVN